VLSLLGEPSVIFPRGTEGSPFQQRANRNAIAAKARVALTSIMANSADFVRDGPMKDVEYTKLPKSREEAKARGLDRYFTGVPCKHGHIAPRYVSTNNCLPCQAEHARRRRGWQARPSSETYLEIVRKIVERLP
jgi:hypothetical protein